MQMRNEWVETSQASRLPKPLAHILACKIRQNIIMGIYVPGSVLREQQLEKEFGSSRGPVRESLRMLLVSGLVVQEPRRGFRVKRHTTQEIREIFNLRSILEGYIFNELRGRNIEPLLGMLTESLQRMQHHLDAGSQDLYFEESDAFHKIILDYTGNRPLSAILQYLNELSLPLQYRLLGEDFRTAQSYRHYQCILENLQQKDFFRCQELSRSAILKSVHAITALSETDDHRKKH
jgi:DNA-binding GntR family transcriptional regulator